MGRTRPIRLSEETRRFAFDSLAAKYGKETAKTPFVSMDDYPDFENLSEMEKYNAAIYEITEKATIRICENEKISGAATFGDSISHYIPARYRDERIFLVYHI